MSVTTKHFKKILPLLLIVMCFGVVSFIFLRSLLIYTKYREKTSFTPEETYVLWSELGLDHIDQDISKAYFNDSLYVYAEGPDSVDAAVEYLKQFEGNENVHKDNYSEKRVFPDSHEHEVIRIYDIKYNMDIQNIECYYVNENGNNYLVFYKPEVKKNNKEYDLYEMFDF